MKILAYCTYAVLILVIGVIVHDLFGPTASPKKTTTDKDLTDPRGSAEIVRDSTLDAPTRIVDGAPAVVDEEGVIHADKPVEKTELINAADPEPEDRLASGDLDDSEPAPEGCGAEVVGIDPDLAARDRPGDLVVKNEFEVKFQDEINPYSLISTTILPGDSMEIEVVMDDSAAIFSAASEGGSLEDLGDRRWRWTAPDEKGFHCVKVTNTTSGQTSCINTFVLVPYDGEPSLNGYKIGEYQKIPLNNDPAYNVPTGFIEVNESNRDTWLSPHFQLRQFLCKQEGDYPKYVLISPRLLLKLEFILEAVQEAGIPTSSFYITSGYRTPAYNVAIGNSTRYSRHSYGDAADIFVDIDQNGKIDDLSRDGKIDNADPRVLYDLVDEMTGKPDYQRFSGGLGFYEVKKWRTGFIHVDTRGSEVRW